MNDLQLYFESNDRRLIHKWTHYFEIYDRHFSRFRGTDVHLVEIGVYHGGSLQMWRDYFGPNAKIIGIDIDPRCKEFEEEGIEIIIGNQEDRNFLANLREKLPRIDILLDDGGHTVRQQIVSFEELFSHVSENGVYLCEDLHTSYWSEYGGGFRYSESFIEYSKKLIDSLNAWHSKDPGSFRVTDFTRSAYSMDYYGSILVIEKRPVAVPRDRMTGRPSFLEEETTYLKDWVDTNLLECQKNPVPESLQSLMAELNSKNFGLQDDFQKSQTQLRQAYDQLHLTNLELQRLQAESFQTQEQLHQTQEQLHQSQEQLHQTQEQLHQTQEQLHQSQEQLHQTQAESEHLYDQLSDQEVTAKAQLETIQDQAEFRLHVVRTELHCIHQDLQEKQEKLKSMRARLDGRLVERRKELERAQLRITAMESSKFWQIRNSWLKLKRSLGFSTEDVSPFIIIDLNAPSPQIPKLAAKTDQKKLEKSITPEHQTASPIALYERWIEQNTPKLEDLERMVEIMAVLREHPLISIVMPVYNTPEAYLHEAINSVINQLYPHWELCIADDASTEKHVRRMLEKYARQDARIKLVFREENGHISRCSNSAVELAVGEYIALLDHDDILPPEALYEVVFLINQHPDADMIYSDEDKLAEDGKRCNPFFKPDWCPDSFLSRMYTCHFGVYRRSIINEIGGFRPGFEGSQDYDLALRFTEKTDKIYHLPKILYHWRVHPQSTAAKIEAKPYAVIAGERALVEALERRETSGQVIAIPKMPGFFTIHYDIQSHKLVSIIIPTRDLGNLVNQCLESIFTKTTYPNFEVILIDNGSTEDYTKKVINDWLNKEPERFRCYFLGIPFNYSKLNNYGVEKANGDYLLFLNNDTEIVSPDWIEGMVEQAQRSSIGAVGATLLYADDTIQHSGVIMGLGGIAGHGHRLASADASGYFGQLTTVNNYTAVTGACLMCRKDVFESVGGFNENLAVAFNDVDLCLKIVTQGYRNIVLPHVVLHHYESKSRGSDNTPDKRGRFLEESDYMQKHWKPLIEHDPCYNPNLSRRYPDFNIREMP